MKKKTPKFQGVRTVRDAARQLLVNKELYQQFADAQATLDSNIRQLVAMFQDVAKSNKGIGQDS